MTTSDPATPEEATMTLRELLDGASQEMGDEGRVTPAPWHTEPDAETEGYLTNINHRGNGYKSALHEYVGSTVSVADAAFIAHWRNAAEALLGVVEAARELRDVWHNECCATDHHCPACERATTALEALDSLEENR